MNVKSKIVLLAAGLGLILVGYQNCSKIKLQPFTVSSYSVSTISTDFCTTPSSTIKSKLKFIFVVDRSAPNCLRQSPDGPGTDTDGSRRFQQVLNFLQNYTPTDPNYTYYGFVNFSTQAAPEYFTANGTGFNPTTDPSKQFFINGTGGQNSMYNYVNGQYGQFTPALCVDHGFTDYELAVQAAHDQINNDIQAAQHDHDILGKPIIASSYVVFFISGNAPYVIDIKTNQRALESLANINKIVSSIMGLQNTNPNYVENIAFNSAFYTDVASDAASANGPLLIADDNTTHDYLNSMATTGLGSFLESTQKGQVIDFRKFVIPDKVDRYELKDVWVYNANTVWDFDNYGKPYLAPDSDGDGLSDAMELKLGSDPNKYDSDGNGLGDGVEYRLFGKPCFSANCQAQTVGTPQCQSFICKSNTMTKPDGTVVTNPACQNWTPSSVGFMQDTDLDDLNDCEEVLLGSQRDNPDSNNDYIPDGLAFHAGIQIANASNAATTDSDYDGVTDYQEVKYNTPVNYDNSKIPNLKTVQYFLKQTSSTADQDCYHLDVAGMVFQGNSDHIRVYIIERPRVLTNHLAFRRAESAEAFGYLYIPPEAYQLYQK